MPVFKSKTWVSTYDCKHNVSVSDVTQHKAFKGGCFGICFHSKTWGRAASRCSANYANYNQVTNLTWERIAKKSSREIGNEGLEGRESGGGGSGWR